nr:hypothetical protein CFP56_43673 [Quercus suber]
MTQAATLETQPNKPFISKANTYLITFKINNETASMQRLVNGNLNFDPDKPGLFRRKSVMINLHHLSQAPTYVPGCFFGYQVERSPPALPFTQCRKLLHVVHTIGVDIDMYPDDRKATSSSCPSELFGVD